ncbi:MAG TPA: enoyl-CoA hydratase/isomerase family protein [Dehalococcoidia bacterium]|jgi:enoyl-CoA hydratase|nr:enoyl-CoA hydratase/isomerase family protein [Dehalococcoidia bacterium]
MPAYRFIATRQEGPALVAALTNPPRNFLNATMVAELDALADAVEADERVRALILTGGVDGVFIMHYDVGELVRVSDAARERASVGEGPELHAMHRMLLKLQRLSKPVIAAINGVAMGGGCELALACDFRYMAAGGRIGLPEVRVGILPGAGGTQRMARLLGVAKALELMLLGDTVDAETAERIGLVHRAVEPDRLLDEALALANELAKRPALSVALIKRCVLEGVELPLEEALHLEQDAFWRTMRSEDAARLMRLYLQGEQPLDRV